SRPPSAQERPDELCARRCPVEARPSCPGPRHLARTAARYPSGQRLPTQSPTTVSPPCQQTTGQYMAVRPAEDIKRGGLSQQHWGAGWGALSGSRSVAPSRRRSPPRMQGKCATGSICWTVMAMLPLPAELSRQDHSAVQFQIIAPPSSHAKIVWFSLAP